LQSPFKPLFKRKSGVETAMKVVDMMMRRVITVTPNASILQCGATDAASM
jgi:hypothetical protein